MATLVKIRGLTRGAGGGDIARGFRVRSGMGKRYDSGVQANRTIGAANTQVKYTAKYGGTYGNGIHVEQLDPAGNNVALSVAVTYRSDGFPLISVTLATDGASAPTSTAQEVIDAVNAHAEAKRFVTAGVGTGNGTGVAVAGADSALTSGTDVGVGEPIYEVVNNASGVVIVDVDDPLTQRDLRRTSNKFISLGQP